MCSPRWAYATAGHAAPVLLDAIAEEAAGRGLRDFKPQDLANTAWAYAAADRPAPARSLAATPLCSAARRSAGFGSRSGPVPAAPVAAVAGGARRRLAAAAARARPQRCRDAFCQEEGAPSRLQRDVAASLRALGLAPREEVRTLQGYSLDAVVSHGGREVAVEVDGPCFALSRAHTHRRDGAQARRQLRAAGWALLPVP